MIRKITFQEAHHVAMALMDLLLVLALLSRQRQALVEHIYI